MENENQKQKIEQLELIFTKAPKQVKSLVHQLYKAKRHTIPFLEVFTKSDVEPYQVIQVEETILVAFNMYVSRSHRLWLELYALQEETMKKP